MALRTPALVMLVSILSSCAVFAPKDRSQRNADIPEQFSLYSENFDTTNRWWETFGSAELNVLIDDALTNSPSIRQAWARLAQAEAIAIKAGAASSPSLSYGGDARFAKDSVGNATTKPYTTTESYSLGLAASYELDLWGRIKSERQAAALDREVSREALNTSAITLTSQVALRWMGILAQRLQTEVIHQQVEANKTSLELIELRFRKSFATALDVYQQRQVVAGTEARIPPAEQREELLINELSVLLGRSDSGSVNLVEKQLPVIGPLPNIGIPADILANRPDVRAAGMKLKSADWQVSAARAERLPTIRLTASAEYRNSEWADLFDDWFANLAASITGPIFEGGRRKAEVERTRAVVEERLAAYRETVLNAIKEVEDALVSEQKQHEFIVALDRNLELSRNTLREATNRYRNGLVEYLNVLSAMRNKQTLERDRVAAQFTLLQYRIDLYRALGGTWPNELLSN